MKPVVEQTWGWDDVDQRARFDATFEPGRLQVVLRGGEDIGVLSVEDRADHVFLRSIEVLPGWQGRAIGTSIIWDVVADARARNLPVRLQVLKVNPARALYERLGFQHLASTPTHHVMETRASADANAIADG